MTGCVNAPLALPIDNLGNVIPLSLDAFQRLRVSSPQTIFDSKQNYDTQPLYWTTLVTGGATIVYSNSRASSLLSVVGGVDRAVRQTKRYFPYQPGKAQLFDITFVMTAGGQANVTKRAGAFDDDNGIFYQLVGTAPSIVMRSNVSGAPVDTVIPRASWTDQLDGNGPSHINLSLGAAQILAINYEWLGVGDVAVGFIINHQFIPVYIFPNSNVITSVYIQTPNLPVRYEIISSGGAGSLEVICCSVISEGGQNFVSTQRSQERPALIAIGNGVTNQIIAIRNKAAQYLHTPISPFGISVQCVAAGQGYWRLLMNPTVAGAFTAVSVPNSAVEYDVTRTTVTVGTGTQMACGAFSSVTREATAQINEALSLGVTLAGVRDELVLAITNTSAAGSDNYFGVISWIEYN